MNKSQKTKKTKIVNKKIFLHYLEPQVKIHGFEFVHIDKLDKIKNNSIEEIVIQDLLEYHNDADNTGIINKLCAKLSVGGKIHIQGLDSKALCYGVTYAQIDTNTFRALVYGRGKNNMYNVSQIKNLIASEFNTILSINKIKFINGIQYYIECEKHE